MVVEVMTGSSRELLRSNLSPKSHMLDRRQLSAPACDVASRYRQCVFSKPGQLEKLRGDNQK